MFPRVLPFLVLFFIAEITRADSGAAGLVEAEASEDADAGASQGERSAVGPEPGAGIAEGASVSVYVIPVRDQIGQALLFGVRRGMKEAIETDADVVVLDMETPGGRLDVTLEIMEMLGRFEGLTMTYVNTEAISAGAIIAAATNEIWFAPRGIIGAAAPVSGTGEDIPETMKLKVMSYLSARLESFTEGTPYRTEVLRAMMDADYELEIDGKVIKPAGELLTLTAPRALEEYGEPPQPLLGAGMAADLEELLTKKFGAGNYTQGEFIPTWSEELAQWLTAISPLLLGIGLLCIFFEVKTPGFGVAGVAGIVLLSLVFFGHHLAGLSGMEPLLLFMLGFLLVLLEVLLFPGLIFPAAIGLLLMIGSLIWGMADVWPGEAFELTPEMFVRPLINLIAGVLLAVAGAFALARFIPRSWFWDKMILQASVGGGAQGGTGTGAGGGSSLTEVEVGAEGIATTDLFPSGQVEIGGRRYEARIDYASATRGDLVEVIGIGDFGLLVRRKSK